MACFVLVIGCRAADAPPDAPVAFVFLPNGAGVPGSGPHLTTEIPGYSYDVTVGAQAQNLYDQAVISIVDEDTQQTDTFARPFAAVYDGFETCEFSIEVADDAPPDATACEVTAPCWGAAHRRGARARVELTVNGAGTPSVVGEITIGDAAAPHAGLACSTHEDVCGTTQPPPPYGCVPQVCGCPPGTTDMGIDTTACGDTLHRCAC